jgi:hypothetical protein
MARPSEPMLAWLRKLVEGRGINPAQLAKSANLPRARVRKILIGAEPMLVDELVRISTALELQPADMGIPLPEGVPAEPEPVEDPDAVPARVEPVVDPWGNHPEQLFKIGFALGCDFFFLARADELQGGGIPAPVLAKYLGSDMPIRLDAQFHSYNAPRYDDTGVTISLSFDAVHDCRFPWTSVKQVIFFPATPEPGAVRPDADEEEPTPPKPHLRLVT